jgi:hypothetical protein
MLSFKNFDEILRILDECDEDALREIEGLVENHRTKRGLQFQIDNINRATAEWRDKESRVGRPTQCSYINDAKEICIHDVHGPEIEHLF